MPRFNSYSGYGRTLMVKFHCLRCKREEIDELSNRDTNDGYGSLNAIEHPKGWETYGFNLLCPECAQALKDFINNK